MADNFGSKFWANITSEPKRKYRFILNLAGIDSWVITKVDRPSFNVTESEHTFLIINFTIPVKLYGRPSPLRLLIQLILMLLPT